MNTELKLALREMSLGLLYLLSAMALAAVFPLLLLLCQFVKKSKG